MSKFKIFSFCIIGSILEWYDFALFGTLSPLLAHVLFPQRYHKVALLLVFGIFAVGYIIRPFGGLFFGHIGDKYGRKQAVVWSIFLMSINTTAIGLLPTQTNNFFLLFSLFLCLRLLQGFSVGGEYAGIVVFTLETSFGHKRLFFRLSLLYFGVIGSFLLGTVIGRIFLSIHGLQANAWRIPFLISIILGVIAVYSRLKVTESPIFLQMKQRKQTSSFPIKDIVLHHYKEILLLIFLCASSSSAFYYVYTFFPAYLANDLHIQLNNSLDINIIGLSILFIIVPITGFFITLKNVRKFLILGFVAFILLPLPAMLLAQYYGLDSILTIQLIYTVIIGFTSPFWPGFIALLFPENIRFSALAFILGVPMGGLFPFFGLLLKSWTHLEFTTTLLLILMSLCSLTILLIFRKSSLLSINLEPQQTS